MSTRIDLREMGQMLLLAVAIGAATLMTTVRAADPVKPAGPAVKVDKGVPEFGPTVRGGVKSMDVEKLMITVYSKKDGKPNVQTFDLAKDVKVILLVNETKGSQPEGKLADITAGTPVSLQLAADGATVVRIAVSGRGMHASVKGVDAAKHTITVASKGAKGLVEATFSVTKDARIVVPDMKVKGKYERRKLGDLSAGTPVVLQFSARDVRTVTGITVLGRTINGLVQSVDAAKRTVTIGVGEKAQTLPVAADARVWIREDGREREGELADVDEGMKVSFSLSALDQKTVTAIRFGIGGATVKGGK